MKFSEEVVVITGGTAGVGRATARAFAAEGAHIALIARDEDRLQQACSELKDFGIKVLCIPADVADANALEQAAALVEQELGPITIWINNAMTAVLAEVASTSPKEFKRVTEVTYLGYVYGTLAALKHMQPRNSGTIIQVGSALAYRAIPLQASYCAAKHAVRGFTDSLRCELIHNRSQVKVSMVQLPALNTPQFEWVRSKLPKRAQPVPPIYSPQVAADSILYAVEHSPREVFVGLPSALIINLNKLCPKLLDWYLARTAYSSQQTDEPKLKRENNLFTPVKGDFSAVGRFGERTQHAALPFWFTTHLGVLLLFLGALIFALFLSLLF